MGFVTDKKVLFLLLCLIGCFSFPASAQTLGSVVGHIRIARGDVPAQRILVSLELREVSIDSVYTDSSGAFGFHNLSPNAYSVAISDDQYDTVRRSFVIESTMQSPNVFVDITLVPKKNQKGPDESPKGSNPNMMDIHEYSEHFPKAAVKEYKKGINADHSGDRDGAIRHYQKAIEIAPDFYVAHNNLGSDYVAKSDFPSARKEFEQVIRLNQSDADAYFNLSNVCMLTGDLPEAQHFLEEGLRRQPDSALGQFFLGSLNIRLKKFPEAEAALRRAIQTDPQMVQPRLQLVNLLLQQGRKGDAESLLRDFLAAFPDNSFSPQAKQVLQRLEASSKSETRPN
jgi:tetratricopeptide (TPR) repeat protein